VIPKRDDILSTRLNHAPRILQLLISPRVRLGHGHASTGTTALEERLPPRARAHRHLKRALRRQRRPTAAARHSPRVVWQDETCKGLLDPPQRRQAHAQAAQVVREPLQRYNPDAVKATAIKVTKADADADAAAADTAGGTSTGARTRTGASASAGARGGGVALVEEDEQEGDGSDEVQVDYGSPRCGLSAERRRCVL